MTYNLRRSAAMLAFVGLIAACSSDPDVQVVDGQAVDDPVDVDDEAVDNESVDDESADDAAAQLPESVSIVRVEAVEIGSPLTHELSPDGRFFAAEEGDGLCIFPADVDALDEGAEAAAACVPEGPPVPVARWSPDSMRLVFGTDLFISREPSPIQVLGVDGSTTTIHEPPSDDDTLDGEGFHPVFVDADTVAFGRIVGDPVTFEVVTADVATGEQRVAGTIPRSADLEDDAPWLPRYAWNVTTNGTLLVAMGGVGLPLSLWTFDVESGEATRLDSPPSDPEAPFETEWQLHDVRNGISVVFDLATMASRAGRGERAVWWVDDIADDGDPVGLDIDPASDDEVIRFAALSPDGATVAAIVVTGSGPDASVRALSASTVDVLAGSAEWVGVDLPEGSLGSIGLPATFRSLAWNDDGLRLADSGRVYRLIVE